MKSFFKDLIRNIGEDEISFSAASIAFYAWMSFFPLVLVAIAGLGVWLGDEQARREALQLVYKNLPALKAGGLDLDETLEQVSRARGTAGLVGVTTLLYSSLQVVLALQRCLGKMFNQDWKASWLKSRLRALGAMLVLAVLGVLSFAVPVAAGFLPAVEARIAAWIASFFLISLFFAATYQVLQPRRLPWELALAGGAVTAVLWVAANSALVYYFANFGNFQIVYGSFAGVVIVLLACYYLAYVTLIGAEITSVLVSRRSSA